MRLFPALALYAAFGFTVLAPTASAQEDGIGVITVMNESDLAVSYLYASSCQEDEWGDDLLGSDVLASGAHLEVPLNSGCWDLKAIAADGQEVETYTVDLADGDVIVWTVDEE